MGQGRQAPSGVSGAERVAATGSRFASLSDRDLADVHLAALYFRSLGRAFERYSAAHWLLNRIFERKSVCSEADAEELIWASAALADFAHGQLQQNPTSLHAESYLAAAETLRRIGDRYLRRPHPCPDAPPTLPGT